MRNCSFEFGIIRIIFSPAVVTGRRIVDVDRRAEAIFGYSGNISLFLFSQLEE